MANEIIRELDIDVARANTFQAILAQQYDKSTRYILARITNLGTPLEVDSASVVTINFERPHADNADVSDYQAAFLGSVIDGKVKVPLPYWALERDGQVIASISMVASDGRLSTLNFTVKVTPAPFSGASVSEDENVDILLSLIGEVSQAKSDAQAAATAASQAEASAEEAFKKSIASTTISYQVATSGTTEPTGTWLPNPPAVEDGKYLWTKIVITFNDGTTRTAFSIAKQGAKGATGDNGKDGEDGNGIHSVTVTYAASASATEAPTEWSSNIPTVTPGNYLWTKTTFFFTDSTSQVAYTVAKQGETGATGQSGIQAATAGIISFYVDENGDLWCEYIDEGEAPKFEYDRESGDLYYIIN